MAQLWKRFGGEPFLVNPHLGVLGLNPKRKGKTMAKHWGKGHMAWVRSFQKRKRRNPGIGIGGRMRRRHGRRLGRRNPYPMAGLVVNPRRHRKHYQRNPKLFGFNLPPLTTVLYTAAGYVATPVAESFISSYLPVGITGNQIGKYAVRIGTVIGLSYLTQMVLGRAAATMVGIGGGSYVLVSAVREFFPGIIPSTLGAYGGGTRSGGQVVAMRRPVGVGAYNSATRRGVAAPAYGAQRSAHFAGGGGASIVAQRFRRFQ